MVIADTGFWLALANEADTHHAQAQVVIENLREPFDHPVAKFFIEGAKVILEP